MVVPRSSSAARESRFAADRVVRGWLDMGGLEVKWVVQLIVDIGTSGCFRLQAIKVYVCFEVLCLDSSS
jgi:hypothetical protein